MDLKNAYKLLHDGSIAFAKMEMNGINIDVPYMENQLLELNELVADEEKQILGMDEGKLWLKLYPNKMSFDSSQQIGRIFYKELGLKAPKQTKGGDDSADKEALGKLDHPMARALNRRKKIGTLGQKIKEILREVNPDGKVHPHYNLHTVNTYRSSSSNPNWQNVPKRDPFAKKVLRRGIYATEGHIFFEGDYSGLEGRGGAWCHQDPQMLAYLSDKGDMHLDSACDAFKLDPHQVSKPIRQEVKGAFVFPAFYGSYYEDIAHALWDVIIDMNLELTDGTKLKNWIFGQGLDTRDKYKQHIKEVERVFWEERFGVFNAWRKDQYQLYKRRGWFETATGFRFTGYYRRNQVFNYGTQGSAFHCNLWTIIQMTKELEQRGMKSKLIGQIHDSIIADVVEDEFDLFCELIRDISTNRVREHWDWIILPLSMDIEASPVNGTWYDCAEIKL